MTTNPTVFTRNATGLVREVGRLSALFANMSGMSVVLGVLTYTSAPYLFPGSNPVVATFIATGLSLFISLMYALFTWVMPRSGGDYVYVSRTAWPVLGFVANFIITFWFMFYIGLLSNWATTVAISPSLLAIGTITGNSALTSLGNTLTHPVNVAIIWYGNYDCFCPNDDKKCPTNS
jgi:amino acid transporter